MAENEVEHEESLRLSGKMSRGGMAAAIREALGLIGDDATAAEVRAHILSRYPSLAERTEAKTFAMYVSQQRRIARDARTSYLQMYKDLEVKVGRDVMADILLLGQQAGWSTLVRYYDESTDGQADTLPDNQSTGDAGGAG